MTAAPLRAMDELPIALTVPEAAAVLRVGRNKVYDLVHLWHLSGGAEGLRSVSLGRVVRIPRIAILEFLGESISGTPGGSSERPVAGS